MKHTDFKINEYFYTGAGRWKCTDIGTRVIVAIKVLPNGKSEGVLQHPPFDVAESVFDEYDFGGCRLTPFEDE